MRLIRGEGPTPCRILFCGERPGHDEAIEGRPFVGPAGQELWKAVWRILRLDRSDVRVVNLVPTYSNQPPTKAEIAEYEPFLLAELAKTKPEIIVTIGYHAARYFLPQMEGVRGDYFHGLRFRYSYGRQNTRRAVVVPVVHSSAALRQPDRFQNQFAADLQAVRAVLEVRDHDGVDHAVHRPRPYRIGLAEFGAEGLTIGVDTEFSNGRTFVVTLAKEPARPFAAAIETPGNVAPKFLSPALLHAKRLIAHSAKAEYHALRSVGIDLAMAGTVVDDTMLMAYHLQESKSLKVLAYRLLGWEMDEYADLIEPIDEHNVCSVLEAAYETFTKEYARFERRVEIRAKLHRGRFRTLEESRKAARDAVGAPLVPKRILTSLRKIVGDRTTAGTTDTDSDSDRAPRTRKRWTDSTFAACVPLPPEPTWEDLPEAVRYPYAQIDALAARAIDPIFQKRLREQKLLQAYAIDRAVLPFLVRNEQIGMAVDAAELRRLDAEFEHEFDRVCLQINELAGFDFNPLSSEQTADALFDELGIAPTKRTPTGKNFTTADKYLKARRNAHAIVPLVLTARQLNKYRGTYTEKLPTLLVDGRYHPDWNYTGTATGRLAEKIILLIPKHDPQAKIENRVNRAKAIRNCFHATDGHSLVSVDLSQIELRAMAHLSGDEKLLKAYRNGEDLHAGTAHDLLGAPKKKADQDESKHRLPAKTINFGIINGMTEFGMLDQLHENGQLHWTIDDVRDLLKAWFENYAGVDQYWRNQIALAKRQGYVTDLFGARRYIAAIHSHDDQIRAGAERQCLCPIQMSADRISKVWNKKIWRDIIVPNIRKGIYCEPWVRVHDDTTVECDRAIEKDTAAAMLGLVPQLLSIPTLAEAKTAQRWGEL